MNEAIVTETSSWKKYYDNNKYDWDLTPSSPDEYLINDITKDDSWQHIKIYKIHDELDFHDFFENVSNIISGQLKLQYYDKKIITEYNFEEVYLKWNKIFGESVKNGVKPSKYFILDIQKGKTKFNTTSNELVFNTDDGTKKTKKIISSDYEYFWSVYEKVTKNETINGIISKIDRLTDESYRRFFGEFFTPLNFAKKGLDYIDKVIGIEWWHKNYRLWDMAAGTGNLQWHLPTEAYDKTYGSFRNVGKSE